MSGGIGKVDIPKLREVFIDKAEHYLSLMADAHKAQQVKVFRAHAAISSGYFSAARILGAPPNCRPHRTKRGKP